MIVGHLDFRPADFDGLGLGDVGKARLPVAVAVSSASSTTRVAPGKERIRLSLARVERSARRGHESGLSPDCRRRANEPDAIHLKDDPDHP